MPPDFFTVVNSGRYRGFYLRGNVPAQLVPATAVRSRCELTQDLTDAAGDLRNDSASDWHETGSVATSLPPAHKRQQRSLDFRMISMFILPRVNGRAGWIERSGPDPSLINFIAS